MRPDQIERYKRHLLVKEIGGPGQQNLLNARVLIIGAGALGGVAAQILAAAGVGHIIFYDDDRVDISNLQRQTQFSANDVGTPKVEALSRDLTALNDGISLDPVLARWTGQNGLHDADIVLDGSDNFDTRFALNGVSRLEGIPLVSGAVAGWTGQVLVLNDPTDTGSPCYQCFVPSEPPNAGDCNDLGVVGAITHLVASQMSLAAIRFLLGETNGLFGRLQITDGLAGGTRQIRLPKDPECPLCSNVTSPR